MIWINTTRQNRRLYDLLQWNDSVIRNISPNVATISHFRLLSTPDQVKSAGSDQFWWGGIVRWLSTLQGAPCLKHTDALTIYSLVLLTACWRSTLSSFFLMKDNKVQKFQWLLSSVYKTQHYEHAASFKLLCGFICHRTTAWTSILTLYRLSHQDCSFLHSC